MCARQMYSDPDSDSEAAHREQAGDEEEDVDDNSEEMILRSKWVLDGAETLEQCIEKYRNFITFMERLISEGWELTAPVGDDYGFLRKSKQAQAQPADGAAL